MKLTLYRTEHTADSTIGRLSIDGAPFCYTLEDIERPAGAPKVFGQTAIPPGLYQVIITHSPHFGRELPLLVNVPGFDGVRIHPGNTAKDTEGCILVGMDKLADSIGHSRVAFDALFPKLQAAINAGEGVVIEVA
jgi:hypothetical protein